jgi:hypothetical protein
MSFEIPLGEYGRAIHLGIEPVAYPEERCGWMMRSALNHPLWGRTDILWPQVATRERREPQR